MKKYSYSGIDAFGEDNGTFTHPRIEGKETIKVAALTDPDAARILKKLAKGMPIVWYVDDERANREWFHDYHVNDFAIITFSSREYFSQAMKKSLPCDAIVTDIFFPAHKVTSDEQANQLCSIYKKIEETRVAKLPELWEKEKHFWSLDGFDIAHDAVYKRPPIPVFLFSRKGTLLLNIEDFIDESPTVGNSYWLLEKVDPSSTTEKSKRAARLQRKRIMSILGIRRSRFRKLLDALNIGTGGLSVNMRELIRDD